uniref:Uncharacterized protein n=1 Tax=Timspurckia oligopyrenoides TaxID=708627 RepID=A0A7S0ZDB0_9RHOD|mmetsp:Transcript_13286/g.23867  ORF Transcript_13286/g.23867 Transcript_13286/m.23867 type:complete len:309 (+) Transcript_13286:35-961(+)
MYVNIKAVDRICILLRYRSNLGQRWMSKYTTKSFYVDLERNAMKVKTLLDLDKQRIQSGIDQYPKLKHYLEQRNEIRYADGSGGSIKNTEKEEKCVGSQRSETTLNSGVEPVSSHDVTESDLSEVEEVQAESTGNSEDVSLSSVSVVETAEVQESVEDVRKTMMKMHRLSSKDDIDIKAISSDEMVVSTGDGVHPTEFYSPMISPLYSTKSSGKIPQLNNIAIPDLPFSVMLTKKKRVGVHLTTTKKPVVVVDLRELDTKSGEVTSNGITLTVTQWERLMKDAPKINAWIAAAKEKCVADKETPLEQA